MKPGVEDVFILNQRGRVVTGALLGGGTVNRDEHGAIFGVPDGNAMPHQSWREMHQSRMFSIQCR